MDCLGSETDLSCCDCTGGFSSFLACFPAAVSFMVYTIELSRWVGVEIRTYYFQVRFVDVMH